MVEVVYMTEETFSQSGQLSWNSVQIKILLSSSVQKQGACQCQSKQLQRCTRHMITSGEGSGPEGGAGCVHDSTRLS